jgi:hypothetical protein
MLGLFIIEIIGIICFVLARIFLAEQEAGIKSFLQPGLCEARNK